MTLKLYISEKRNLVSSYLTSYLKKEITPEMSRVNTWGNDAVDRILHIAIHGKMLRAALLYLSAETFANYSGTKDAALRVAAALELLHTGLIIHDDIMDDDRMRRHLESIHVQYEHVLTKRGVDNGKKAGESFGICAGDLCFFLGHQLLSEVKPIDSSSKLNLLISQEISKTCVSQMQDVYGGISKKPMSLEDILAIYAYKTGRYTCGLPLVAGAIVEGANVQTIANLWKLGTAFGILFQIRDDELNLFGNPDTTGKPIGSDVREGKQTLYRYFLMKKADSEAKTKLATLFGNAALTTSDLVYVKNQCEKLRISDDIHDIVRQQQQIVDEGIDHLPMEKQYRQMMKEFSEFIINRAA